MTKFLEQPEKTNREAGLTPPDDCATPTPNANGEVVCMICQDNVPEAETYSLACKHPFCRTCWKGYLAEKMEHGKLAARTPCPMFKCPMIMKDSDVQQMADADILSKYNRFVLKSFVEDSRLMRWCPAARCDYVVEVSSGAVKSVRCKCGNRFCFKCDEEAHDPVSCEQLQEWLDKCRNESETAHWIIANTRKCPKCTVRIEKNSGCNHMICQSCKYEFCWVCMGDWAEHGNHTGGFYKCNKYNPKRKKKKAATDAAAAAAASDPDSEDAKEEAKAELDRYIHYFTRYSNHEQSKQWAVRQMETTNRRMAALQGKSNEATWIDVQFLGEATEQVFECRAVLKHTYVFGYYLEDGPEKELFEFLQQNLEKSTEILSELSEQPLDTLDQAEVANYTRVTKAFMHNLLDGISSGLTQ
jgi:ariadne-1